MNWCKASLCEAVVLIDTWWNVNIIFKAKYIAKVTVLIDTWWNVNVQINCLMTTFNLVLIDTWWNVNVYKFVIFKIDFAGFNRYMVECEWIYAPNCKASVFVLIDTWWNVNMYTKRKVTIWENVLIDTWWNVNRIVMV